MKLYITIMLSFLAAFLILCTDGGDKVTGTISETDIGVIGQIVSTDGNPAGNVNVIINSIDSLDMSTAVDTTLTNDTGYYNFEGLASGTYRIEGFKNIDTLKYVVLSDVFNYDSITFSDSSMFVGVDTLLASGAIKGVVLVQGRDHLGTDVYIPGTSYSAKSDSVGSFIISGIPNDSNYSLIFSSQGYVTESADNINVKMNDTTVLEDTIILEYDPDQTPPPPVHLLGVFDTVTNFVTISWDTVAHPNLAGFVVYRKDSVETALEPVLISGSSLINATLYVDTIKNISEGDTVVYQYQVKSQDNKNDKSGFSWPVYVHVWNVSEENDNDTIPTKPILISPVDDSIFNVLEVDLVWKSSGPGISYSICLSNDSASLESGIADTTTDTTYAINELSYNATYYWKVEAFNSNGSVDSDIFKFTTKDTLEDTLLNPKMVLISGGAFVDGWGRSATVDTFLIMENEVTVEMYRMYDSDYVNTKGLSEDNVPVASVAWGDAIRFANWLSNINNLDSCYIHNPSKKKSAYQYWWQWDTLFYEYDTSANGYRLPTGDEWEWAAQGGDNNFDYATDDGTIDSQKAWLPGDESGPKPVKSYNPNSLGLYDMTGNVWESVWDNGAFKPGGRNNYIVPADSANDEAAKRGNGFYYYDITIKVDKQMGGNQTGDANFDCGFRLAKNK